MANGAERCESDAERCITGASAEQSCALATEREVATAMRVDLMTLKRWRRENTGPPWIRLGPRALRYRWSDVAAWLDEQQARDADR